MGIYLIAADLLATEAALQSGAKPRFACGWDSESS